METYFSIAFKTIRRKLGYTQIEFAKLLEIEESELLLIENSKSVPDTPTLYRLDNLAIRNQISYL